MNLYKKDYRKLYPLQDKFFNFFHALDLPFYLTGGTALSRFYLNHRYSEDLDYFVNGDPDFSKFIVRIKDGIVRNFDTDLSKALVSDEFARFFIIEEGSFLKIDFVNDVAFRSGNPIKTPLGDIDNVANVLSNKLSALIGRDEPKDVYDIVSIAKNYSFNWREIFNQAKEKALINEIDVAQYLYGFSVEKFQVVDWLIDAVKIDSLEKQLRIVSDDFLMGKDNSLGEKGPGIENAKLVLNGM